jgi:hypothetical protein
MKKLSPHWWLWLRRGTLGGAALLMLAVLAFFGLPWLTVGDADTATRVDAIYLGAFDPRLRTDEYVVALYRQGVAPKIVCFGNAITCDIFPADFARQQLIDLGIPPANVSVFHTPDTDCRAQLAPPLINSARQNGFRSVLMIGDPAGSRMHRRVFHPKFKVAGIDLFTGYPAAAKAELLDGWWRSHWKMQRMTREPLETGLDFFYAECW